MLLSITDAMTSTVQSMIAAQPAPVSQAPHGKICISATPILTAIPQIINNKMNATRLEIQNTGRFFDVTFLAIKCEIT